MCKICLKYKSPRNVFNARFIESNISKKQIIFGLEIVGMWRKDISHPTDKILIEEDYIYVGGKSDCYVKYSTNCTEYIDTSSIRNPEWRNTKLMVCFNEGTGRYDLYKVL